MGAHHVCAAYCNPHCSFEGACTNSIALSPIPESHTARALHTARECACPEWTDGSTAFLADASESVNMTIRSQFSSIVALLTATALTENGSKRNTPRCVLLESAAGSHSPSPFIMSSSNPRNREGGR
jgi:hypothetical protein